MRHTTTFFSQLFVFPFLILLLLSIICESSYGQTFCQPKTSDCCEDAPILCGFNELNGYTCRNQPPPGTCGPVTLCPNGGVPNNMSWWGFVAGTNFISLRITPSNCTTVPPSFVGIQAGIYKDCSFSRSIDCQGICQQRPFIIAGATKPCQTYYVFIDGCAGSECDFRIEVLSGGEPPEFDSVALSGPTNACVGKFNQFDAKSFSSNMCVPDFLFTVNGIEVGTTSPLLYQFPEEQIYEVCVTAFTGDPEKSCQITESKCINVNVERLPGEEIPMEVLCWEDHHGGGTFFMECGKFVPKTGRYCCESTKPNGCTFQLCKDFVLLPQPGEDTISKVICPNDSLITPKNLFIDTPGVYIIYMRNTLGCDSFSYWNVSALDTSVTVEFNCQGSCVELVINPRDSINSLSHNFYWYTPSGELLSTDPIIKVCGGEEDSLLLRYENYSENQFCYENEILIDSLQYYLLDSMVNLTTISQGSLDSLIIRSFDLNSPGIIKWGSINSNGNIPINPGQLNITQITQHNDSLLILGQSVNSCGQTVNVSHVIKKPKYFDIDEFVDENNYSFPPLGFTRSEEQVSLFSLEYLHRGNLNNALENQFEFSITPNPASEYLRILSQGPGYYRIYNLSSSQVLEIKGTSNFDVDISELASGVYVVTNSQGFSKRLVVLEP